MSVTERTKGLCRLHKVPQLLLLLLILLLLLTLQLVVDGASTMVSEGWRVKLVLETGFTNL